MAITVSVECPACAAAFPVDPDKVPLGGARTECTVCGTPFRVDPDAWGGGGTDPNEPWVADEAEGEGAAAWEEASQAFEGLTVVEDAPEAGADEGAHGTLESPAAEEVVDDTFGSPAGEEGVLDTPETSAAVEGAQEVPEAPAAPEGEDDAPFAEENAPLAEDPAADWAAEGWTEDFATDPTPGEWSEEAPETASEFGIDTEEAADFPVVDVGESGLEAHEQAAHQADGLGEGEGGDLVLDTSGLDEAPEVSSDALGFEGAATEGTEESGFGDVFGDATEGESALEEAAFEAPPFEAATGDEPPFEAPITDEAPFEAPTFDEPPSEAPTFDEPLSETPTFETRGFEKTVLEEAPSADPSFETTSLDGRGTDEAAPMDGAPPTGELVTDQWADLVDAGADGEGEVSSDWGAGEGDSWVLETEEDLGLAGGSVEVERLDTVEDQVRAAKDDPTLTAPAEGLDTNQVSGTEDEGFGDFMSGQETMLPQDALDVDSPALNLQDDPGPAGFSAPPEAAEAAPATDDGGEASTFQFGRRDPHDKARRLARVLVSDMITYNPDRHTQARHNGSVRQDFEDEIQKSWAEYVEQVGPELAESTGYWTEALNEILAGGEPLF